MAIDLEVPQWLADKCATWQTRLSMQEWTISLVLALAPGDDVDVMAEAEQYPDLNFGRITVRADVEDDDTWENVLVHELLHIKHSRIDDVVQKVMQPHLEASAAAMADTMYRATVEPYVHSMALTLVQGYGARRGTS